MPPTKPAPVQTPARPATGRNAAHSPVGTQHPASSAGAGEINAIRVAGEDLAVGDVVRKIPSSGVQELVIQSIVSRTGPYVIAICTNRRKPELGDQQYKLGSANTMDDVIDGPKLEAARKDPTLVEKIPLGWNWKRQVKEVAKV